MPEIFERAFGLRDNPFDPLEFAGVASHLLDDLSTRALQVDDAPELMPLFIPTAGPFEAALGTFAEMLTLAGYSSGDDPKLGAKSFLFRIIGPQGSGKSTLTNVMIDWLRRCLPERGQLFVLKEGLRRPEQLAQQLNAVMGRIVERGPRWCCVAFDDVNGSDEPELHNFYRDLQDSRIHVVLFAIMHDAEDLRRPRLSGRVPVTEFRTCSLTPEYARSFVESRVDLFRVEQARQILCDDLSLYPFNPDDLTLVAPTEPSRNGADPGAVTLRTLNQLLHSGLLKAVRTTPALAELAPDALRAARVRLLELYLEDLQAAA